MFSKIRSWTQPHYHLGKSQNCAVQSGWVVFVLLVPCDFLSFKLFWQNVWSEILSLTLTQRSFLVSFQFVAKEVLAVNVNENKRITLIQNVSQDDSWLSLPVFGWLYVSSLVFVRSGLRCLFRIHYNSGQADAWEASQLIFLLCFIRSTRFGVFHLRSAHFLDKRVFNPLCNRLRSWIV